MNGIIKTIEWNKVCRLCLRALSRCDVLGESSMNDPSDLDHDHHHRLQRIHNIFAEDYLSESCHGSRFSPESTSPSSRFNCPCHLSDNGNDGNDDNGYDDNCRLNCNKICECCDSSGSGCGSVCGISSNCIKCSNPPAIRSLTISNVPFYPTLLLSKRPKSCRSHRFLRPQERLPSPDGCNQLNAMETVVSPARKEDKLPQQKQQQELKQIDPDADCDESPHITVQMLQCLSIEVSRGHVTHTIKCAPTTHSLIHI